jgi:4-amino-4-deoxy-L-arabinose transferase-like glycosyltransferase
MSGFPMRTSTILAWILCAGLGLRLGYCVAAGLNVPPAPGSDQNECQIIARNLLRGAGYRGISWGEPHEHPTAVRPPVTPFCWALGFALFGERFDVLRVADAVCGTLSILLLFLIGRRMFNARVGLLAAGVFAAWPASILLTSSLATEPLFVLLELLFVWLCLWAGDRPGLNLKRFVPAGLCAGVASLTRPNLLLLLPLLPLWSAVVFRRDVRALVQSLAVPVVAVAVIAPWTYRNYRVFHRFVPVSTLSGTNLLVGNNELVVKYPDRTGYLLDDKIPGFQGRARGMNEAERDELALQMARTWLSHNRDQWAFLVWIKLKRFCTPVLYQPSRVARGAMLASWGPVFPLALPALVATLWSFTRNRDIGLIVHALILSALTGYLVLYVIPRYRFPIEPFFILLAAVSVDWLATREDSSRSCVELRGS